MKAAGVLTMFHPPRKKGTNLVRFVAAEEPFKGIEDTAQLAQPMRLDLHDIRQRENVLKHS
jgi:hypothetical protein